MKRIITAFAATVSAFALGGCVTSTLYTNRVEAAYPKTGETVTVNGHDVNVLTAGETGPVVLMIHGASANAKEFSWTLAPRVDDDLRVLMADRPGQGYSVRFDNAETLGAQAAQMAGVLDQLAPGEQAVVVGHSFGGAVALRLALDRPDLVEGLVLLAPVTHDWGGGGEAWYNAIASAPVAGRIFSQIVPLVGPAQVDSGIASVFEPAPAPDGYLEKSAIDLLFRPPSFRANAKDVDRLQEELAAQSPRYPELHIPVVVFSGEGDTVIKPALHVGKLADQIPVEVYSYPDEGHMPHHGKGAAVADAIRRLASGEDTR